MPEAEKITIGFRYACHGIVQGYIGTQARPLYGIVPIRGQVKLAIGDLCERIDKYGLIPPWPYDSDVNDGLYGNVAVTASLHGAGDMQLFDVTVEDKRLKPMAVKDYLHESFETLYAHIHTYLVKDGFDPDPVEPPAEEAP